MRVQASHSRIDFLELRREAAVSGLLEQQPEASPERDAVLLRVLGRECRAGEDMEAYRSLLCSAQSRCDEPMTIDNSSASSQHPHHGKTFEELQSFLDGCAPLYKRIAELSSPLPKASFYRRNSKEHAEAEASDGKFDHRELFARGFPPYIGAFYVSDGRKTIERFGDTEQSVTMQPDTHYLDLRDRDVKRSLRNIFREEGFSPSYPIYDLFYKAGIDMVRYRPAGGGESWYNIFNPDAVASVKLSSTESVEPSATP